MAAKSNSCPRCGGLRTTRHFSTTTRRPRTLRTTAAKVIPKGAPPPPLYPFPPARWYKQRNNGLYGTVNLLSGNNVSEEVEIKTRRQWHPNIVRKHIYSVALERKLRLKVSTRVLRTIDKVGGLDEYLLGGKAARMKELGPEGWQLRWAVLQTPWGQERARQDLSLMAGQVVSVNELVTDDTEVTEETDLQPATNQAQEQKRLDMEERIAQRLRGSPAEGMPQVPAQLGLWRRLMNLFRK